MRSRPIFKRHRRSKRSTVLARPKKAEVGSGDSEAVREELEESRNNLGCPNPQLELTTPPKPYLLGLPVELLAMILEQLEDITTLVSVVETCPAFSLAFNENSRKIITTIFAKICAKVRGYDVGKLFWQLAFAIHHCFIPREHIEEALAMSWPIFADRQLDELLLPLATALARSCINKRKDAAIKLLTNVWQRKPPFCRPELKHAAISKKRPPSYNQRPPSYNQRPPSYTTVGSLLHDLVDEPEKKSIEAEMARLDASRNALDAYGIQVNNKGVTLTTEPGPDTITVFFPPRLPLESRPCRFGLEVARRFDSCADEDLRRRMLPLRVSNTSSTYTNTRMG